MRIFTPVAVRHLCATLAAIGAGALTGCAGDTNPVRDAAVAAGIGAKLTPAPDFVVKSRPGTLDYIPVGTSAPARASPARSAQEVKAAEEELEKVRAANQAAAEDAQSEGAAAAAAPAKKPKPAR